ncbi:MAG: flippase [Gaiellales bacterium]|nr:MAG: flippase [Gaiellales bacterium]
MKSISRVPLNAILMSSSQLIRAAIGFIFFIFLAQRLGPTDFGRYMFAFALAEIFSIFGDFGLHEYSIREIARRPEDLPRRLPGLLVLKTLLSSSSAVIMLAILPLMGKDEATSLAVAAFALAQIGYSWFYASTVAFAARQDLHLQAFLWLLEKALFAAAGASLLLAGRGLVAVALSNTAVQFAGGALAVLIAWRRYGPLARSLAASDWVPWLRAALPFGLIVAFYLVYFRIDSVMISFIRGDVEVGQYNAAYNIISALLIIPAGLVAALFPKLAGMFDSPGDDIDAPFQKAARWLIAISLPLAVGGWLLARPLIELLLGQDYLPAVNALAVLSWTLPVWFVTFLQGNLLTIIERQKAVAAVGFINMTANVVLNLLVIPRYGFTGAAVTTLVTEAIGLMQMFYLLRRNISFRSTAATALRVALVSAGLGLAVFLLRGSLPVLAVIAVTAAGYGAAVVGLGIIPAREIRGIFRREPETLEASGIGPLDPGP